MAAHPDDDDKTRSFIPLTSDTVIGHYRIIEKIGAGGMGEVYLAEDTRLNRKVALKFLPTHLCQDEECRRRFTREAQSAAKLDHPNIVPVYEVGEHNDRPFYAMALIEGRSLREVIREDKLSVSDTIGLTMQVCEGLQEAHESGVVHRDIKPGNIIIDTENRPRIVDFGLATVSGQKRLTEAGSTLGTLGYMSPEQIEGKQVDHRSDIFSIGVILYEMLTGRRPFEGNNDAATTRSITDSEPEPIARYKSGTSGKLQEIVDKSLSKDPSMRYQHADELAADLRRIGIGHSHRHLGKRRWFIVTPAVFLIAGLILVFYYFSGRVAIETEQEYRKKQITFDGDVYPFSIDLSPDGRHLTYIRGQILDTRDSEPMSAYVKDLEGGDPILIHKDQKVTNVSWSPDGRKLLVRADNDSIGGFYIYPRLGGSARRYQLGTLSIWWKLTWSPDGSRFAASCDLTRDEVYFVSLESGDIRTLRLTGEFDWIYSISWSPRGDLLLVRTRHGNDYRYWMVDIDDGAMSEMDASWMQNPRWGSDGRSIVFQRHDEHECSLLEIPVDPETGAIDGEPVTIVGDLEAAHRVTMCRDRSRIALVRSLSWSNLWMVELDSTKESGVRSKRAITTGTAWYDGPAFSPDGRTLSFARHVDGLRRIHLMDMAGGEVRQLTFTGFADFGPVWSPDGRRLAYATTDDNGSHVAIISVNGGTPDVYDSTSVGSENSDMHPLTWEPGRSILYREPGDVIVKQLDPVSRNTAPIVPEDSTFLKYHAVYSPSGDEVALFWNRPAPVSEHGAQIESDRATWIISLKDGSRRRVCDMAEPVRYTPDGSSMYIWFWQDRRLETIHLTSGERDTIVVLPEAHDISGTLSPDCDRLVYRVIGQTSDVVLAERVESGR